jgi:peptidoglycan/LPS O-acetylase OafA/YrhL
LKHRTDIDGLRGVAVLTVFANHLELAGFSGGFVGVDVFFVISGYVIALAVAGRHAEGRFSLIDFWERRTRRLTPALLVMLLATTAMAMVHMFPKGLETFAGSVLATLTFVSNIFFWQTTDYFAAPPDAHPLLHTWSLGVEEQFYIVFPLVMLACWRWAAGRFRVALGILAALSFGLGVWAAETDPVAAFYLPFGRAWELLIGVLLALAPVHAPKDQRWRAAMGVVGLLLIAGSVIFYKAWTAMPGLAALPPCLGALMLLSAGEDTPTGRLLSNRLLRFFGLISYSLYLWHWPLISLKRGLWGPEAGGWLAILAVFAAATLLAWLSWRFIETPVRLRKDGLSTPRFYLAALVAVLLTAMPAGIILATGGLPGRFSPEVLKIAASGQRTERREESCMTQPDGPLRAWPAGCIAVDPVKPDWLLMGDSHANHLWYGLSQARPDINLMQAASAACRMTLRPHPGATAQCRRLNADLYGGLLVKRPPDRVILSGLWRAEDEAAVRETLRWFRKRGLKVVLIGPSPEYERALPELLALEKHLGDPQLARRRMRARAFEVDPIFARVAREEGVAYVSLLDILCPEDECRTLSPEGKPMQFDQGHYSRSGSRWIGERIAASAAFR